MSITRKSNWTLAMSSRVKCDGGRSFFLDILVSLDQIG